jgi:hypothetical protein
MMVALASLYRRWKYVEEDLATSSVAEAPSADGEPFRTRRAIERGERQLADYRLNGCVVLARECEANLRSLRTHLAALEF